MNIGTMIATIMAAVADVISHIIALVQAGDDDEAVRVVGRFVSTTETQLYNDRREAEDILNGRFDTQPSPGEED